LETGSDKDLHLVVPSLRVDVLGAKAFKTSRAYFSKGIAGGNVSLNGQAAGKSSTAAAGDEIYADGLGWVRVVALEGSTKKGNHKVHLRVESSR
jgi:RNA-binding protein YlmH